MINGTELKYSLFADYATFFNNGEKGSFERLVDIENKDFSKFYTLVKSIPTNVANNLKNVQGIHQTEKKQVPFK